MWSLGFALCSLLISSLVANTHCNPVADFELLHRVSAAFINIDSARSNGGFVTAEDLKSILAGLHIATSGTSKLIKLMDTSNDGVVTYDEYIQLVDLLTIFYTVDTDASGTISEKELTSTIPEDVLNQVNIKKELKDRVLDFYEFAEFRMKLNRKNMSLSAGALDAIVESIQQGSNVSVENIVELLGVFQVSNIDKQELFKVLDVSGNGQLDISELNTPWDLLLQFKIVDSDGTNFVSAKELQSLFDSQTNTKPRNAIDEIKKINNAKKYQLNFVEFLTLFKDHPELSTFSSTNKTVVSVRPPPPP